MTKHIIGFIIFSLIVGTSAFVSGFFYGSPDTAFETRYEGFYVEKREKRKKRKKKCRPHHRFHDGEDATVSIVSAVYDERTGRLKTEFDFDGAPEQFEIELRFFVRDRFGRRDIKTEVIQGSSWTRNYEDSYQWMSRFEQVSDLWMTARIRVDEDGWTSPSSAFSGEWTELTVINSGGGDGLGSPDGKIPVVRGHRVFE